MSTITRRTLVNIVRRYSRVTHQLTSKPSLPVFINPNHKLYRTIGIHRPLSTKVETNVADDQNIDALNGEKRDFQAETRMLLDIVAKSLYSNTEVFLRELISNASDALGKLRYVAVQENLSENIGSLELKIHTNKQEQLLTIEDNGIGMSKEELISNLGTIARSGSRAFLEEAKNKSADISNIIGQFGVGFYSCFIVAKKVEVFTKSREPDAQGYCWSYDGTSQYEIKKIDNLSRGTKIVLHLKPECREYADDTRVRSIIKKYSNFIDFPIFVNNEKCNVIQPLWLADPKQITDDEHTEFYRFISNSFDKPRYQLHYRTDVPMGIKALLYIPTVKPMMTEVNRGEVNVSLYTRRVLIKNKANEILPEWCGFLTGVVDCEDIPLNLSRELLQNSPLIAKVRSVLRNRIIKFLSQCAQKNPDDYNEFYRDYQLYLKAGVLTTDEHDVKEEIAKLLRFETSKTKPGEVKSLTHYLREMPNDQENIYYLFAPSRGLAEASPYHDTLKKKGIEVIFCHELYDEHVLMSLQKFRTKKIISAEEEIKSTDEKNVDFGDDALRRSEIDTLLSWTKDELKGKVNEVKATSKLDSHPCVVTVENMGAARHLLKMQHIQKKMSMEMKESILAPCLELNPKHPIIKKLNTLRQSNPEIASLLVKQLYYNSMLTADLIEDPSSILINMNDLLTKTLEKI